MAAFRRWFMVGGENLQKGEALPYMEMRIIIGGLAAGKFIPAPSFPTPRI